MNHRKLGDISNLSMLELFQVETETQTAVLISGLLELERGHGSAGQLELLMRAAHSLKGAARIINLELAVRVAHAMEDCFVAAQHDKLRIAQSEIDTLLRGVDILSQLSKEADPAKIPTDKSQEAILVIEMLRRLLPGSDPSQSSGHSPASTQLTRSSSPSQNEATPASLEDFDQARTVVHVPDSTTALAPARHETSERVVRLTAENLNRLLGLAGESLVESRWLRPFAESLQRVRRQHAELSEQLEQLRQSIDPGRPSERIKVRFQELSRRMTDFHHLLSRRVDEIDSFDRRSAHLSHRLYLEVLRTRMRPFSEGVRRFPRMVRDLARSLGKDVRLEVLGENTQVDRDILERLETPMAHLIRNAVDHGCESTEQRIRAGKPPEGLIRVEARHSAGMLLITIADDGAGVEPERLRKIVVQKNLTVPSVAEKLSETELLEFLFLPGFTLKESVTELSGRGVGLDIVQNMVKNVRGAIRLSTQPGRGLRVQIQLPLTLSVLRALLVDIAGEPYAIPLAQITRTLKVNPAEIKTLEGRHYFPFGDHEIGLLSARQVLECGPARPPETDLCVVIIGDRYSKYGLVVDRFLSERELVVQALDSRLGKIADINAAALMEDGSPVLIIDVEDMVRSIEKLIAGNHFGPAQAGEFGTLPKRRKKILAVDDSLTVRELERKLLSKCGYAVDVAVDGMDAWNAARSRQYELIITDVDMPRMDGIELTALIKKDPRLKATPVMVVSYKDNEQDRLRGLEAGADYYLTKGSFHDERLLEAVVDLIGEPEA